MKFDEKLRNLRKENKLSQEELADKLKVSRQAVSKWESGNSYPEMEKLLEICKIFDCTLEELTNEKVVIEEKTKSMKYVSRLGYYIKKAVNMFSKMSFSQILKMVITMFIIALCITIIKIPINYLINLGNNVLGEYNNAFSNILNNSWYFLLNLVYVIAEMVLLLYIFKVKYLDNYEYKDEKTELEIKDTPKQSEGKATEFIYKLIILGVKIMLVFMSVPFLFGEVFATFGFIILIWLFTKGIPFIGAFIGCISVIILITLILIFVIYFIFDKKVNVKKFTIIFIIGLLTFGIGCGIFALEMTRFDVSDRVLTDKEYSIESKEFDYIEGREIYSYFSHDVEYVVDETLTDKVLIKVYYFEKNGVPSFMDEEHGIHIYSGDDEFNKDLINDFLDGLSKNKIYKYKNKSKVEIISSTKNIEQIKLNVPNED